jgi:hypothetical protein
MKSTQQRRINISYVTWASEYIPCPQELDFVPTIEVSGICSGTVLTTLDHGQLEVGPLTVNTSEVPS